MTDEGNLKSQYVSDDGGDCSIEMNTLHSCEDLMNEIKVTI